jgi:O-antigen/teichoic acid export membrane protein
LAEDSSGLKLLLALGFFMAVQSLKQRTINSAIWTLLGYGSSQVLRFGSNLILARLLVPQDFGLMSIINILLMGIVLFSDIGIVQSIVNNPRGEDRDFLDTAWTAQLIRGVVLWGVCLLLAWPVAAFYHEPRLLALIPIAGLTALIDGFQTTRMFVAQRRLEQRRYNIYQLITQIISLSCLVGLAYWQKNVWALVIGGVLNAIITTIGSYYFFRGPRHRFFWDKNAVEELVNLGRWVFFASATMFVAEQLDRVILAKLVDWSTIGVYSIAYNLASLPRELIRTMSYRVIYPAAAQQASSSRSQLRSKLLDQRRWLLLGSGGLLALLVTSGDLVITVLYNEKYAQAIWMMPLLSGGIWFSVLFHSMSNVLLAIGKPMYAAQSYALRLIMVAIGLPLGFQYGQLPGAVLVIALSDLPPYFVNLYGLWREQLSCLRQDLIYTVYFLVLLTLCLAGRYSLGFGYPIQRLFAS